MVAGGIGSASVMDYYGQEDLELGDVVMHKNKALVLWRQASMFVSVRSDKALVLFRSQDSQRQTAAVAVAVAVHRSACVCAWLCACGRQACPVMSSLLWPVSQHHPYRPYLQPSAQGMQLFVCSLDPNGGRDLPQRPGWRD